MIRSFKTKTAALTTAGVLALGGGAYAATSSNAPAPLTGSVTDKAADAAVAKYPGSTLVGLESESDGGYEAQVRKADGTQVELTLDKTFTVTATRTGGPGHGGHGGGMDTAALAKALGVTEAKLQAALSAVGPAQGDRGADRAAAVAQALGVSASDVRSVLDAQGATGDRGGHGDDSALVTALAKKTGKSASAVRTALDAARTGRSDALASALAKELGLDAAKVKTALQAARPAGRP
jgi:UDP-N-acetylmuramyl pentapeptide synthase